jgi:guanylate kinase
MIEADDFLEHAEVHGNTYGTSRRSLHDLNSRGVIGILEIDVRGAQQVMDAWRGKQRPLCVFVAPTDLAALEARLRGRGTEDDATIARRMHGARRELAFVHSEVGMALFDAIIVNADLQDAYACQHLQSGFALGRHCIAIYVRCVHTLVGFADTES